VKQGCFASKKRRGLSHNYSATIEKRGFRAEAPPFRMCAATGRAAPQRLNSLRKERAVKEKRAAPKISSRLARKTKAA